MIELNYEKSFFGEKGITATSANYLANIAKESLNETQRFIENISFYSTDVSYIGSNAKSRVRKAVSRQDFENIKKRIQSMCAYNAFIAWVREAIKEKDLMLSLMKNYDIDRYMRNRGIVLERPERPIDYDSDDAIKEMNIGQRYLYLKAEACAATYGQLIHPNKPLSNARKKLSVLVNTPVEVVGEGRDALVYEHVFDLTSQEIDDLFFELQDTYRTFEKTLNNTKHDIKQKVFATNASRMAEYRNACEAYESKRSEIYAEFTKWREEQINEIHMLKIVIPDNLKGVYEKLNKMGKADKA